MPVLLMKYVAGRDRWYQTAPKGNRLGNAQAEGPRRPYIWKVAAELSAEGIALSQAEPTDGAMQLVALIELGGGGLPLRQHVARHPLRLQTPSYCQDNGRRLWPLPYTKRHGKSKTPSSRRFFEFRGPGLKALR